MFKLNLEKARGPRAQIANIHWITEKAKRLSEEALQIAEKRKDIKCKGEKERYIHPKAEFQRIQGEIRKPSSVINAKKQRKIIEWEKLVIASRKL